MPPIPFDFWFLGMNSSKVVVFENKIVVWKKEYLFCLTLLQFYDRARPSAVCLGNNAIIPESASTEKFCASFDKLFLHRFLQ